MWSADVFAVAAGKATNRACDDPLPNDSIFGAAQVQHRTPKRSRGSFFVGSKNTSHSCSQYAS